MFNKRKTIDRIALSSLVACIAGCGGGGGGDSEQPAAVNRSPVIAATSPIEVRGSILHYFDYDLGQMVSDPDGDSLTYTIVSLPDWLSFDGERFTGMPMQVVEIEIDFLVRDGRGGLASATIDLTIEPNAAPTPAPSEPVFFGIGAHVNYDATQGGTAFGDLDGDPLTYTLAHLSPPRGLSVAGTHIVGAIDTFGTVVFQLTAEDPFGAVGEKVVVLVAEAPEPGEPVFPAGSYAYADDTVPVPISRGHPVGISPWWDTMRPDNATTDAGAALGRVLFYDKRLSISNTHACSSCHEQGHGFASPERFNTGVPGVLLKRNTMALGNARFSESDLYFSDQRAHTLETLTLMPIEDLNELGNSLPRLEAKLAATDYYPPLFEAAFGSPEVTSERIATALAQFVRSLLSYRAKIDSVPFERFPDRPGDLTAQELRGERLFKAEAGCARCHDDTRLHITDRAANNGLDAVVTDPGVGGGRFRVASLRNIAVTAPYMHDGRFATLLEVIDHYDSGIQFSDQLSDHLARGGEAIRLNLSDEDKEALVAYLHTLTDEAFLNDPTFSDPFR